MNHELCSVVNNNDEEEEKKKKEEKRMVVNAILLLLLCWWCGISANLILLFFSICSKIARHTTQLLALFFLNFGHATLLGLHTK